MSAGGAGLTLFDDEGVVRGLLAGKAFEHRILVLPLWECPACKEPMGVYNAFIIYYPPIYSTWKCHGCHGEFTARINKDILERNQTHIGKFVDHWLVIYTWAKRELPDVHGVIFSVLANQSLMLVPTISM